MGKAKGPTYRVGFRRRREHKTRYKKRLALLKSRKPRLVVRKTNRGIIVQVITFYPEGDRTVVMKVNKHLEKLGWPAKRNTPTAYLLGYMAGKEALKKGIQEVVLDIGLHSPTKGSLVFAALKGAMDAGLKAKLGMELDESRIKGEHIAEYAKLLKEKGLYEKAYSAYIKKGFKPEELPQLFESIKAKLEG